jgi:hypothetical protein
MEFVAYDSVNLTETIQQIETEVPSIKKIQNILHTVITEVNWDNKTEHNNLKALQDNGNVMAKEYFTYHRDSSHLNYNLTKR